MTEDTEPAIPAPPPPDVVVSVDPAPSDRQIATMTEIARLSTLVDKLQRTLAAPSQSGEAAHGDILCRIERLESWVASNRLP